MDMVVIEGVPEPIGPVVIGACPTREILACWLASPYKVVRALALGTRPDGVGLGDVLQAVNGLRRASRFAEQHGMWASCDYMRSALSRFYGALRAGERERFDLYHERWYDAFEDLCWAAAAVDAESKRDGGFMWPMSVELARVPCQSLIETEWMLVAPRWFCEAIRDTVDAPYYGVDDDVIEASFDGETVIV